MRKFLALAACLVFAAPAIAGPVALDLAVTKDFTDCSSGGSSAQTLVAGNYLVTVHDEAVFLCLAASGSTCASGGRKLPAGFAAIITVGRDQVSASCRSAASGGDIEFTRAG